MRAFFVVLAAAVLGSVHADDVGDGFQVKVCARFRPISTDFRGNAQTGGQKVVLPLHQRLNLIRMQENNCSLSEAQRILWEPRGGKIHHLPLRLANHAWS